MSNYSCYSLFYRREKNKFAAIRIINKNLFIKVGSNKRTLIYSEGAIYVVNLRSVYSAIQHKAENTGHTELIYPVI